MPDILGSYLASDVDESGDTKYYGFLSRSGAWYIMTVTDIATRYSKGSSGYVAAWTGRAALEYDYLNEVFG